MLQPIEEVRKRINRGEPLLLAGSESALSQLPRGNWIGGTIPYFMDGDGGICTETEIFATQMPEGTLEATFHQYTISELPSICKDAARNGFTFVIIPAGSSAHKTYAKHAPDYEGIFSQPVVGWISGVHVSQIGQRKPLGFFGPTGEGSCEAAVVMHGALSADKMAQLQIINIFEADDREAIAFPASGFQASDCVIDGRPRGFARYLRDRCHDTRLPLIADYNGTPVNVSIQSVDESNELVKFYAPVFSGVEYKLAKPIVDYVAAFENALRPHQEEATFSCNCILNYLHAGLEGRRIRGLTGPITFGEIAHQLFNQTAVRLCIRDISRHEK